jgi:hypothetical protein
MGSFVPFCAFHCCAMLLKARCEAVSQRGGQRFETAQLHHKINNLDQKSRNDQKSRGNNKTAI